MVKKSPSPVPWLEAVFLCSPLLLAAWLSGSRAIMAAAAGLVGLGLGFWSLRRRARNADSRLSLSGCLVLLACPAAVLAPFLIKICLDLARNQSRHVAVVCVCLAGGYLSARLLRAGRKSIGLRALGLLALGASIFWGVAALSYLKWEPGPDWEDIAGWRFKWSGPEAERK